MRQANQDALYYNNNAERFVGWRRLAPNCTKVIMGLFVVLFAILATAYAQQAYTSQYFSDSKWFGLLSFSCFRCRQQRPLVTTREWSEHSTGVTLSET